MADVIKKNKCFRDLAEIRQTFTFDSLGHGETKSDYVMFKRDDTNTIPIGVASLGSMHLHLVDGLDDLIEVRAVCTDVEGYSGVDTQLFVYVTNTSDTYDATDVIVNAAAI